MILIMPRKDKTHKLNEIIKNITGDLLVDIINAKYSVQVNLRFPKFTLKMKTPVKEALTKVSIYKCQGG